MGPLAFRSVKPGRGDCPRLIPGQEQVQDGQVRSTDVSCQGQRLRDHQHGSRQGVGGGSDGASDGGGSGVHENA